MDKTEISSKMLVDFLPILYQKVKNYFELSKRPPLAVIRYHAIKLSCPKNLVWKSCWTILYNPDHCTIGRGGVQKKGIKVHIFHYKIYVSNYLLV